MRATVGLTLGILGLAVLAGLAAFWFAPKELQLEGRPLSAVLGDLTSTTESTRIAATNLLRKSSTKVVPALVEMARADDEAFVKKMKALAEAGQLDSAKLDPPSVRRSRALNGFRALGASGASATPALTEMLRNPKTSVAAALALACIGGEALNPLFDTLMDANPRLAGNARTALDSLSPATPDSAGIMIPRIKSESPVVRAAAARALGMTGQDFERAIPLLIELLEDRDSSVQSAASYGLGTLQAKARVAVPKLLPLAKQTKDKFLHDTAGVAVWRIDAAEARKASLDESLIKAPVYSGPTER